MSGFFDVQEIKEMSPATSVAGCPSCGLLNKCLHPKMKCTGEGRLGIYILGEAPGEEEDKKGIQLIGKAGQRLRRTLRGMGLDLDRDFVKDNSLMCRPPGNETPKPLQVEACRSHVFENINRVQPRVIIALGGIAVQSLLGGRWTHDNNLSISRWRNLAIPDYTLGAWICPTYHPSYLERKKYEPVLDVLWRRDLEQALELAQRPLPPQLKPKVNKIWTTDELNSYLMGVLRRGTQASQDNPLILFFDYETTGKKPYAAIQRIKSCSFAESPKEGFGWLWDLMDARSFTLFRRIMENPGIKKGGANIKYEHNWTKAQTSRFGPPICIRGWWWDCNISGHIEDVRPGNSNVKFQAYSRLGVEDYDSHIKPFLRQADPNGINRIDELDPEELLDYNVLDSCYEFAVALEQRVAMGYPRVPRPELYWY